MTTKRKRLQVTLSDEAWDLINEVHDMTGTAKSAILSEIIDEVIPVFRNQIQALRLLKDQPREAQRIIQNFANESIGRVAQQQLELSAAFDARTVQGKRAKKGAGRGAT